MCQVKNNGNGKGRKRPDQNGGLDNVATQNENGISKVVGLSDSAQSARKRPKRSAACTSFKEKKFKLNEKDSLIEVKKESLAEGEDVAIVFTSEGEMQQTPQRRIMDFIVHDEDGKSQPIELLDVMQLFITGVMIPLNGAVDKQRGLRCEGFGPIESWSITGYEQGSPVVWICTDMAEYICTKPAGVYKNAYNSLFEKAMVCVEVYRALSKPDGGDPTLSLDELIARVSRCLVSGSGKTNASIPYFNRDWFFSQGKLVVDQLTALDEHADAKEQIFSGLPALQALQKEYLERTQVSRIANPVAVQSKALTINENRSFGEGGSSSANMVSEPDSFDEDEKLAKLLQEQEDRNAYNRQNRRSSTASKAKVYIKINEDEIANDYPLPAYYKADEEETDEYILFDDDASALAPEDLPRRMLHDWALYNSESRLISLELLPMLAGAEADIDIFGSGIMTEDDGNDFGLDDNVQNSAQNNVEQLHLASGSSTVLESNARKPEGIRIYLSAIKEWMIEFGASMVFVSIRTDGAWYRLGSPSQQYAPWFKPVLKTAKLAIKVITMLKESSRVSRLSFADVVRNLVQDDKDDPTFISSKIPDVERYVVVHGQIILQQFAEYPDDSIKKSSFIIGLMAKMEQRHHTKLMFSKKKVILRKGKNLNPRAYLRPDGTKRKPMRATTTKLVHRIWSEYYVKFSLDAEVDQAVLENGVPEAEELQEEVEDGEQDEETTLTPALSKNIHRRLKSSGKSSTHAKAKWIGKSVGSTPVAKAIYKKASFGGDDLQAGGAVLVDVEEGGEDEHEHKPNVLLIEYLYEKDDGSCMLHGRVLERGTKTVLGNAADERELFLTDVCEDIAICDIKGTAKVEIRRQPWGHSNRKANAMEDEEDRARAKERELKGLPVEYFCRYFYAPEKGAFLSLPYDSIAVGNGMCNCNRVKEEKLEKQKTCILENNDGFKFEGTEYHVNDFLYLDPDAFELLEDGNEQVEKFKAGRNKGLRAYVICQLLSIKAAVGAVKKANVATSRLTVKRFYRPEDISILKAYKADIHEIYYSEDTATVQLNVVRGKCDVRRYQEVIDSSGICTVKNTFFCSCIYDPQKGTIKQLPANVKLSSKISERFTAQCKLEEKSAKSKGKGKLVEDDRPLPKSDEMSSEHVLRTLDIFAGCGGLSEGLQQSGVTDTRWAIEYEHPAAEAFKVNHPKAEVFCENCNVILRSIMEKGGDLDDCLSTPEAAELSSKLTEEQKSKLPMPGNVDFINGGPPCQGFSGMNRFNQRTWSKVQCEMILAFLSYADYFRPRFFLLENVRNFVSFNKGQTFRLTLRSLLEMGYQVRFGILQAGNYGVSQSRTRAFIWAAAPTEQLPDWPEPTHVFAGSSLKIALSGGQSYAAVKDAAQGAPFRSMTVRDTIGDLPPVCNGADKSEISYGNDPESWFQKQIRGEEKILYDHISKEMNELNLLRCQRIPKQPGADWRDLPDEKVKLSTGQIVDLIPWCLPNTADRHNQWKGLFGRLDWDGNFPTSVTDPQPMGKVGMCFHPEQDRIVTVRECARSQGFPDSFKFCGTIQSKHRQIGNAVPPPLAKAIGEKLKEVVELRHCN
ncbi:hypothetical protein O6H91_10G041100 [Diphasiastrum complanatum]|uniref:Uncharacterized protein n=1 Tax=Diphasiastrum complanatum TaxID=34168 RepID=A0ACC2CGF3_DIPCM|nr:hypothetical protein O6H91_10G041100 [Diphasiastrum complanatum]